MPKQPEPSKPATSEPTASKQLSKSTKRSFPCTRCPTTTNQHRQLPDPPWPKSGECATFKSAKYSKYTKLKFARFHPAKQQRPTNAENWFTDLKHVEPKHVEF